MSRAPVKSLLYDTPYARVTQAGVDLAVELYSTDLEVFAHRRLPRFYRSSSFHSRGCSSLQWEPLN